VTRAGPAGRGFLERLDEPSRTALAAAGREVRYRQGASVFRVGDPGGFVVLITGGRAKVVASTAEGTEVLLGIRGPGELLGELAALDADHAARLASLVALEPLTCRVVPVGEFSTFLEAHPQAMVELLRTMADRMRDAERRRVEAGAYSTSRRLAGLLAELSDTYGRTADDGVHVELPLSQQELAGLVGASRESVARAFKTLRDHDLVSTAARSVVVRDVGALRGFAD
jgi:CRP/FNR family cyclic AMP-dependent transcriptional regulator